MPLVTTEKMFKDAYDGGYAIGAFNVNNMEIIQGIVEAANELKSPLILQVSKGAREYIGKEMVPFLAQAATEYVKSVDSNIPIALHLDHGPDLATCKDCIDYGFSSVMIDASHHSFEENIRESKEVADYAHQNDVTVEAELGVLAGVEDDVVAEAHIYTQPDEVEEFVKKAEIIDILKEINTSKKNYLLFSRYMEALIAFHKYYGGKEQ